ncbi:uncharacterized protein BJ171DRAFT_223024 [Polychytrium aggregatum]|uniref:uncharacterized protein n=1 Tax=Polychytrium aggregatum TaxID=110093 RepID=UPI0022FED816|nr:uncharacterized protein BJ171DRAFT_223024 [Polychytrium aggregatum]KAI9197355.1 hypothetical protein BJ171DRAFT_223024 [Polychytrium aggregatum]
MAADSKSKWDGIHAWEREAARAPANPQQSIRQINNRKCSPPRPASERPWIHSPSTDSTLRREPSQQHGHGSSGNHRSHDSDIGSHTRPKNSGHSTRSGSRGQYIDDHGHADDQHHRESKHHHRSSRHDPHHASPDYDIDGRITNGYRNRSGHRSDPINSDLNDDILADHSGALRHHHEPHRLSGSLDSPRRTRPQHYIRHDDRHSRSYDDQAGHSIDGRRHPHDDQRSDLQWPSPDRVSRVQAIPSPSGSRSIVGAASRNERDRWDHDAHNSDLYHPSDLLTSTNDLLTNPARSPDASSRYAHSPKAKKTVRWSESDPPYAQALPRSASPTSQPSTAHHRPHSPDKPAMSQYSASPTSQRRVEAQRGDPTRICITITRTDAPHSLAVGSEHSPKHSDAPSSQRGPRARPIEREQAYWRRKQRSPQRQLGDGDRSDPNPTKTSRTVLAHAWEECDGGPQATGESRIHGTSARSGHSSSGVDLQKACPDDDEADEPLPATEHLNWADEWEEMDFSQKPVFE